MTVESDIQKISLIGDDFIYGLLHFNQNMGNYPISQIPRGIGTFGLDHDQTIPEHDPGFDICRPHTSLPLFITTNAASMC
jgi:hypothetical protein